MTPEPSAVPELPLPTPVATLETPAPVRAASEGVLVSRNAIYFFLVVALLALISSVLLWQKLSGIQEQLVAAVRARGGALDADRLDDLVIAIEIATAGAPVQFAESPRAT